jgi:hypothetical protein
MPPSCRAFWSRCGSARAATPNERARALRRRTARSNGHVAKHQSVLEYVRRGSYLSPDFFVHSVSYFIEAALQHHRRVRSCCNISTGAGPLLPHLEFGLVSTGPVQMLGGVGPVPVQVWAG